LLRFARRMHRRETSAIHAQLGDFAVWIRRRNDGSFTSPVEPQTPRSLGLEAVASERSRRMADNARADDTRRAPLMHRRKLRAAPRIDAAAIRNRSAGDDEAVN